MEHKRTNLWWGPPKYFSDRTKDRKISWLELFYDLAYVAVIGQLTHQLVKDPTWSTVGDMFLIFALMFWSWVNGSQYYDLHGSDGIRTRAFTFLQMLAVSAAAIAIPGIFEGHLLAFTLSFLVLQSLINYLWWSVGLYDPTHKVLNFPYFVSYSLGMVLLGASAFCEARVAKMIWLGVIFLDITPALLAAPRINRILNQRGQVFTASATLVERFGLFTIIILTESILGTVSGISEIKERHALAWFAVGLGLLIAFLLSSLYFDMTSEQETKEGYGYMLGLIYLHYPLLVCLSIVGACIKLLLTHMGGSISPTIETIFCVAIATILFMVVGLTRIMQEEEEDRSYIRPVSKLLVVIGACLLVLPWLGKHLNPLAFLGAVSGLLIIPVLVGVRSWARYQLIVTRHEPENGLKPRVDVGHRLEVKREL